MFYLVAAAFIVLLAWRLAVAPEWQDAIGGSMAGVAKPLLVPLVDLINKPSFVYVVSIFILLSAVGVCIYYWLRVARPELRRLRRLEGAIRSLAGPRQRGHDGADALAELGRVLGPAAVFGPSWAAYHGEARRTGRVPAAPYAPLALHDLGAIEGTRGGLMQALPGYYTSAGLVLTFVGLVVALYFAGKGFQSGDVGEAREAILRLLNASSFKFLISVAALSSALLISLVANLSHSAVRRAARRTIEAADQHLDALRATQAPPAAEPTLTDVVERLDRLIAGIQTLADRLAIEPPGVRQPLDAT
ncbi:hypothetical protein [Chelatococcus reniformis]|uniref:MotA/TolQ/ExbB proton channel domain-containing protein n=1 Tax=Chelatococcus reniformis TaxID=1494448 RepID=A0A916UG99_9HYPH|nr:hypothetical protein [Chelatococcus reniformis]GGC69820.1 hypothetical protein GCM10010994_30470 [Chelatococcus reniformis]